MPPTARYHGYLHYHYDTVLRTKQWERVRYSGRSVEDAVNAVRDVLRDVLEEIED